VSKNRTEMVRKLINEGFYFDLGLIEYAIINDSDKVVKLLVSEPLSILGQDKAILFEWIPMYLNVSVSSNSYHTTKFLFEYVKNRYTKLSQLWPQNHLLYCVDTEWKIRLSQSAAWIKALNNHPFDCMRYAYENGALMSPLFVRKLKDMIQHFDLYPLLSDSKKEWIKELEQHVQLQLLSIPIPVVPATTIEQSLIDLSHCLMSLYKQ
jgi:hypothetical protein